MVGACRWQVPLIRQRQVEQVGRRPAAGFSIAKLGWSMTVPPFRDGYSPSAFFPPGNGSTFAFSSMNELARPFMARRCTSSDPLA